MYRPLHPSCLKAILAATDPQSLCRSSRYVGSTGYSVVLLPLLVLSYSSGSSCQPRGACHEECILGSCMGTAPLSISVCDFEAGILCARHDPLFPAEFERFDRRERMEGISEARAGNCLKNGASTGRQATHMERLNSIETTQVKHGRRQVSLLQSVILVAA